MDKEELAIIDYQGVRLQGSFYKDPSAENRGIILYIHGGGFVFGDREDLPDTYLKLLTQAGYSILAMDYLLAPESPLKDILEGLEACLDWYNKEGYLSLGLDKPDYFLFGRSAGSYAAYYLAGRRKVPNLLGLIAFYGYYNLKDAAFLYPSRQAMAYPRVDFDKVKSVIKDQPHAKNSRGDDRYLLYLYARQTGSWMDFLLEDPGEMDDFSLSISELQDLPPTFIAHGRQDPDVPFRQGQVLAKQIEEVEFLPLDTADHDFDRTQPGKLGLPTYKQLINWLNQLERK